MKSSLVNKISADTLISLTILTSIFIQNYTLQNYINSQNLTISTLNDDLLNLSDDILNLSNRLIEEETINIFNSLAIEKLGKLVHKNQLDINANLADIRLQKSEVITYAIEDVWEDLSGMWQEFNDLQLLLRTIEVELHKK